MELRCPNCQQMVMGGDELCWQCGQKLPQVENAGTPLAAAPSPTFQLQIPPLYLYSLFTIALFLLAVFFMRQLSQTPLVQAKTVWLPADWHHVTNANQTVTLDLPQSWTWFDAYRPLHQPFFAQLPTAILENGSPLLIPSAKDKLLFWAAPTENWADAPVSLIVIESPPLNALSAAQALERVEQSDAKIVVGELVENFDKSHALFLLDLITSSQNQMRCRQQFIPATDPFPAWLVAICGQMANYPTYDRDINAILQSFQRLRP